MSVAGSSYVALCCSVNSTSHWKPLAKDVARKQSGREGSGPQYSSTDAPQMTQLPPSRLHTLKICLHSAVPQDGNHSFNTWAFGGTYHIQIVGNISPRITQFLRDRLRLNSNLRGKYSVVFCRLILSDPLINTGSSNPWGPLVPKWRGHPT